MPLSNWRSPPQRVTFKSFSAVAVPRADGDAALRPQRQRLVQVEGDELVLDARRVVVEGFAEEVVAIHVGRR